MAGELWRSLSQIGKEVTAGTGVASTRIMYFENPMLSIDREPREHRFAVGARDNVRNRSNGPIQAGGSLVQRLSASEIIELLQFSIQGGVTPTTPLGATNARLWTFKPSETVDSWTMEWHDGARPWRGVGMRGNNLTIAGSVTEQTNVSVDLFGTNVTQQALTGSLTHRVPDFLEGWQTRLFMDPFGSAPGGVMIPGTLMNWSVPIANNMERSYTADNTLAANEVHFGELGITSSLTFKASSAHALTEFNNWTAATKRTIRLEFIGPASGIEAGANEVQTLTVTGSPTTGTWIPSFMGVAGTALASTATASATQAVLEAIPTIGVGNVLVTGGPFPGTPLVVTFVGNWAEYDVPLLTTPDTFDVGGVTPAETTPGRSGRQFITVDLPGAWTAINLGGTSGVIRTYELSQSYVYEPTVIAAGVQIRVQNARTAAYA